MLSAVDGGVGAFWRKQWAGIVETLRRQAIADHNRAQDAILKAGADELRLLGPGGVHFSKEFLRRVYRGTPWFDALTKAKRLAKERGERDWKKICREELGQKPEPLPAEALESARLLYPSLAEALSHGLLGLSVYEEMPTVRDLCRRMGASV